MADIKITLETLYDILRNEKKREDLQKLDATFFIDVVQYLREKKSLLDSKQHSNELFAAGERDKLEYELRSIKRILKEIYEKREKKIMDIAMNKSRTGSDIIDTSSMLSLERDFYNRILKTLDDFRKGVLLNLFNADLPLVPDQRKLEVAEKPEKSPHPVTSISGTTKIKLLHPLPSFVWKDLKVYGPFDQGEEVEIFAEVADLIVRKGRAMKV